MSDKPLIGSTSAEQAMAANARSRVRQGKQHDLSGQATAESAQLTEDVKEPRRGRDTD
jgi:hypothetical protein